MGVDTFYSILPDTYGNQIRGLSMRGVEELRMRVGQPLCMRTQKEEKQLWPRVESRHLEEVVQRASRFSAYAYADSLRDGYLTIKGGHRIGICGSGFIRDGELQSIRLPTSVCIRVANQITGCAELLFRSLRGSMLILGPPGRGKTTLLRDLLVHLSDRGLQRIGLVDERGEIAACVEGTPQLYVGSRTDVLTNIRKDSGIMILMRSMNPQWIAVDEITAEHDIHAMEQASYCGVKLIATAHGESLADLKKRPLYKKLLNTGVFGQAAVIYPDRTYRIEEIEI